LGPLLYRHVVSLQGQEQGDLVLNVSSEYGHHAGLMHWPTQPLLAGAQLTTGNH